MPSSHWHRLQCCIFLCSCNSFVLLDLLLGNTAASFVSLLHNTLSASTVDLSLRGASADVRFRLQLACCRRTRSSMNTQGITNGWNEVGLFVISSSILLWRRRCRLEHNFRTLSFAASTRFALDPDKLRTCLSALRSLHFNTKPSCSGDRGLTSTMDLGDANMATAATSTCTGGVQGRSTNNTCGIVHGCNTCCCIVSIDHYRFLIVSVMVVWRGGE